MAAIQSFSQVIHNGYDVLFQGDAFTDLNTVEEVIVAMNHGKNSAEHTSSFEQHALLFEDGDAILMEGQKRLALRRIEVIGTAGVPYIETYGWDHIYDGKDLSDHTPEFWSHYETECRLKHKLACATALLGSKIDKIRETAAKTIEEVSKQLKHLDAHAESDVFHKNAIENWNMRQDSLICSLEVLGNLRKLAGVVHPAVVYRRSLLFAGKTHVLPDPARFPELQPSVEKVLAFLKKRNAIIIAPKNS